VANQHPLVLYGHPQAALRQRGQHQGWSTFFMQRAEQVEQLNSSSIVDEDFDDLDYPLTGETLDRTLYNTGR